MAKKIYEGDLQEIIDIVSQFPTGASLNDVILKLKKTIPRRTLQYRLSYLVQNNFLLSTGEKKGIKYQVLADGVAFIPKEKTNANIILSKDSELILEELDLPEHRKRQVSYNLNFLDSYMPNSTFYLSETMRKQLHKWGSQNGQHRPAGTYARQIYNRLLIDLSWNSSRLEGNTYSLLETERLLEHGEVAEGKNAIDAQMILNHKDAIEYLVDCAEEIKVNRHTILNLHALLSYNLLIDPNACGRLRLAPVRIGKSIYRPLEIPQMVEENFKKIIDKGEAIKDPFEQAFFLMVHLPYLQPFLDVNKRVSRLAANIPLVRENLCPISFVDVPDSIYIKGLLAIYELNKVELLRDLFFWAYERSSGFYSATRELIGEPDPFRTRYRKQIFEVVSEVVRNKFSKKQAIIFIQERSNELISEQDQPRFIEVVEVELRSLHDGNIARYRLRPSEFAAWHSLW